MKNKNKEIFKTLLFILPYIAVEFTNTILIVIDKSISNSIGKMALVVFSSFITLNWAINTLQYCIGLSHSIVLVRNKKDDKNINTTGVFLELIFSILTGVFVYIFSKNIANIYQLDNDARNMLKVILRLKAIQLPFVSMGYIIKNDLKIKEKTKTIFQITVISSIVNIIGDLVSIKMGYNEIGIYFATIISTIIETFLLFKTSKFMLGSIKKTYIREILKYGKDLAFNRIIQRIVNIMYTSIASSFGPTIYTIHCACVVVSDTLSEIVYKGYYNGLLVDYSHDIENKKKNLLKKVDLIEIYSTFFSVIFLIIIIYPSWLLLGRVVTWNECNPYIWFYCIDFILEVANNNYIAYLASNKNTKAIKIIPLIGGVCVRLPLALLVGRFDMGLLGLSLVCVIDKIVRLIYLRLYIRRESKKNLLYG